LLDASATSELPQFLVVRKLLLQRFCVELLNSFQYLYLVRNVVYNGNLDNVCATLRFPLSKWIT
jgi:hypothetical protein